MTTNRVIGFNDPKPPDRTKRVWCDDCTMSHICKTDHGPDGHGGSAICCPIKKLLTGAVEAKVTTADEGRRMASLGFISSDGGSTWHLPGPELVRCYVCKERVPKEFTWKARHRVPSGVTNTRKAFTYRMVRKCNPTCEVASLSAEGA